MSNLKEVRTRIASVKSTKQITSAMKLVAASKLHRAQAAIINLRPYASKLQEILQRVSESLDQTSSNSFFVFSELKKVLLIPISSNRGLCGAFNANIIKKTEQLINTEYSGVEVQLLCIGKKMSDYFKRHEFNVIASHGDIFGDLKFENVAPIAENLMKNFKAGEFDKVEIIYNQFKNATTQNLINEQYLPIKPPEVEEDTRKGEDVFIFEPSKEEILEELIPKTLKTQLYKAILDSNASEHGARMTAMHQATENAADILKELKLLYNKARQAAITNEILEIVGGANALKD